MSLVITRVWYVSFLLFCSFLFIGTSSSRVDAALDTAESKVISDSEEPSDRRIYSYDMGVDSQSNVHIIYSKPLGDRTAEIFYIRQVAGVWQAPMLLSSSGFRASISTNLVVGTDNRIHVSYLKDVGGTTAALYYRTVNNGVTTPELLVANGGWHSRMQLDSNGRPVFVREGETWPEQVSKLILLTSQDGETWDSSPLPLADVTRFRIADFVVENGAYHVTYGDSRYSYEVWNGKWMTARVMGVFHDFHYATSEDGVSWIEHTIDSSHTLYEMEFWTTMVLDGGKPVIGMYKYAEYGNKYNTGTSAVSYKWNGSTWLQKGITDTSYPDSREGMGVGLVVNGSGDYFGAWDYSPDYPQDDDFRGERGNIALARSGANGDWEPKAQVDPFSLEGRAKLCIYGNYLFFLALGDFVDAKLYFRKYNIAALAEDLPVSLSAKGGGKALPAVYLLVR
ncbi:MAG: hypothetical protein KJ804_20560 [Proteobacteria bacterium]|nr:hypothetical protein [Pseudomonadota bacterium]MBU1060701.1 hypothetical protein [Pseudomonadota bacterium]